MNESDEAFEEVSKTLALFVLACTLAIGCFIGYYFHDGQVKEESYRQKVNFCHDRMKNDQIRYTWRQQYCGKVKIEAIDPITGKPVMGIVEGE